MSSTAVPRIRRRMLPAFFPPLVEAAPKQPPHLLALPRDAAGHPWPTELDVRGGPRPPELLAMLLEALTAVPPGTTQYLRFRGDPGPLLSGLAENAIDSVAEAMPDGSWRLRAVAPA